MDKIIFILMIATALFIVYSKNFKRIIVALGAFSMLASFCYLIYHAPDVAIAEAIIGSALSTILYIVSLKKHRTFYVYFTSSENNKDSDFKLRSRTNDIASIIMEYCNENDLEAQSIFSWETPTEIANEHFYDIILHNNGDKITVYGSEDELHVNLIKAQLAENFSQNKVEFATIASNEII